MSLQNRRYAAARPPSLAEGWSLERLTPVSRLFGANGLRTGPDGRIYLSADAEGSVLALPPGTHASLSSTKLRKTQWNITL